MIAIVGVAILVYLGHRILTRRMEARAGLAARKSEEETQSADLVENGQEEPSTVSDT